MKTKPNDPINGCIHGATIDPEAQGLTKREQSIMMNQAAIIQGRYANPNTNFIPNADIEQIAKEALLHTDALFAALKAEQDEADPPVDPPPDPDPVPPPLTPDQM